MMQLDNAEREKIDKRHPRQANIQRPERYFGGSVAPSIRTGQVAQAKEQQSGGEHAVNAHHRGVGVIGSEGRADLVIADDRQVDQETINSGAEKIPDAYGHQKPDGPAVEVITLDGLLLTRFNKRPGFESQQQQRN